MNTDTLDLLKVANRLNKTLHFNILKDRCSLLDKNLQLIKLNNGYKYEEVCNDLIVAFIKLSDTYSKFVTTTYDIHELHDLHVDYDNKSFAPKLIFELKSKLVETGTNILNELTGYVNSKYIEEVQLFLDTH